MQLLCVGSPIAWVMLIASTLLLRALGCVRAANTQVGKWVRGAPSVRSHASEAHCLD